jgi:hypothetical protein
LSDNQRQTTAARTAATAYPSGVLLLIGVGGPRLDVAPGGWDLWPLAGLVVVLWIGRRVLHVSWGWELLVAGVVGALVLPVTVHAWGVVGTAAIVLGVTLVLLIARARGSTKGNDTV